jgi:hypothetical protein
VVTVIVILGTVALTIAAGIWLSWRSPAVLSEEDNPLRPLVSDGVGRPAGPDAEAMGVIDRGYIETGPPPPGGVPTDAPRPRPAPRRMRHRLRRRRARDRRARPR